MNMAYVMGADYPAAFSFACIFARHRYRPRAIIKERPRLATKQAREHRKAKGNPYVCNAIFIACQLLEPVARRHVRKWDCLVVRMSPPMIRSP